MFVHLSPTNAAPLAALAHLLLLRHEIVLHQFYLGAQLFVFLLQGCVVFDVLVQLQFHLQYLRAQLNHFPNSVGVVRQLRTGRFLLPPRLLPDALSQGHRLRYLGLAGHRTRLEVVLVDPVLQDRQFPLVAGQLVQQSPLVPLQLFLHLLMMFVALPHFPDDDLQLSDFRLVHPDIVGKAPQSSADIKFLPVLLVLQLVQQQVVVHVLTLFSQ